MEWKILPIHLLLLLSVLLIQQVSSQDLSSCAGRCGEGYSRDTPCNCDYNCQHYMECCPDFKRVCTVEVSCKGRCFESFARGRECDCDSQCKKYGKCCPDYDDFCEEVKDNKKPTPKKKPTPEPSVADEAGSGLDNDDIKPTPTPDKSTTQRSQVTTTSKVTTVKTVNPKPSQLPNSETTKDTSSTTNKETTVKTQETSVTTKETSASATEKTTSTKETRSAEKTSAKDLVATSVSAKSTTEAETTTKSLTSTTPKKPSPTTPKEPTTTPMTSKEPAPTTPKEPAPTSPETPVPTTSEASTPATTTEPSTPPKNPAASTSAVEPTPKALENSPKEPALPTTKAPEETKPEMTTTAKDKTTEKGMHTTTEITTATSESTTRETAASTEDKTTESKITSTTTEVTSTTTKDTMTSETTPKETTLATKRTTTEETMTTSEETTVSKDTATNSKVTTPKSPKPTKAPKMPTSTKKPNTTPKVRKPKPTPSPPKTTTATVPTVNSASSREVVLQTTTSSNQAPNSEIAEENPENEDANAAGEKPYVILRPPVLTPIIIPGTDFTVRGPSQGLGINPMVSDETDLCNGKPVDGLTTLANGTLVAFRGHYFWMLNPSSPPSPPRRITEVWGIPSPIDTVFTRCNCEGKTFFFKDSQYWRFTNDIKDPGYPKQIVKGFGGLTGKIVAALSIPKYKDRPESVYFFKRGGRIQQYTYRQEPNRKCTGRRPAVHYPVYGETTQVRRRRFERAIGSQTHTIRIHYSPPVRVLYQDKGFLHNEVKVSSMWRGLPSVVTSAVSLPNIRKPDGYDYYAFSKDHYYNVDVPSRTARAITTRSGQTLSNAWYNCPQTDGQRNN